MSDHKPYVIIAGVDYSESGDLALQQAIEIGVRQGRAEVHAVSVVTLLLPPLDPTAFPTTPIEAIPIEDATSTLARHVDKKLNEVAAKVGPVGRDRLPRVVTHVRLQAPAQEIAQLASDLDADLVVVGTHGRRGVARALLGSVAEVVVRLSPCPVLVVRAKKLVTIATIEPPCPECVKTRQATQGQKFWCEQHSERHGQRHTYHSTDRVSADGSMPLVFHE